MEKPVPYLIQMVATKIVSGIIQEINTEISGELTSERLGEYQANIQKVSDMANHLDIHDILNQFRIIEL